MILNLNSKKKDNCGCGCNDGGENNLFITNCKFMTTQDTCDGLNICDLSIPVSSFQKLEFVLKPLEIKKIPKSLIRIIKLIDNEDCLFRLIDDNFLLRFVINYNLKLNFVLEDITQDITNSTLNFILTPNNTNYNPNWNNYVTVLTFNNFNNWYSFHNFSWNDLRQNNLSNNSILPVITSSNEFTFDFSGSILNSDVSVVIPINSWKYEFDLNLKYNLNTSVFTYTISNLKINGLLVSNEIYTIEISKSSILVSNRLECNLNLNLFSFDNKKYQNLKSLLFLAHLSTDEFVELYNPKKTDISVDVALFNLI